MSTTFSTTKIDVNGVTVTRTDCHHTSDDDFALDYDMTPDSGTPSVPTSASLVLATTASGTATKTVAATVTDNTTSYNIRAVILQADLPAVGVYYMRCTETHSTSPLKRTPVWGFLTIEEV